MGRKTEAYVIEVLFPVTINRMAVALLLIHRDQAGTQK